MNAKTSRSIAALSLLAAGGFGLAMPAQAQEVTVTLDGEHGNSEGACTQIAKLFGGFDCTYGGTNAVGTFAGWAGPALGGTYYEVGSTGDDITYTPVVGDAKINPTITGTLTVDGTGATATVAGTIIVGPAARNIGTGQATRAVESWTSITHTLAETTVSSAVANGEGGFDYVIGSGGAPEEICLAGGGACFGNHENGSQTTTGPVDSWGVGGVGGTKPNVGIEDSENLAGITATGAGDERNIGAPTTAVIAGGVCESNDAAAPLDCDESTILWTATSPEDPGYDNLILVFSTDGTGAITSGQGFWVQDYTIALGGSTTDNSEAIGAFTFTGTVGGGGGPDCADFDAGVLQDSADNAIDAVASCTGFTDPVTVTIVTGPTSGTAVIGPAGNIVYTPNAAFAGTDTITYSGTDGTDTSEGVLTITVAADAIVDAPDGDITINTPGVDPTTVPATLDLSTIAGINFGNEPTSITVSAPTNGTATVDETTKIVSYTLNANVFAGTDSFTYTLTDSDGDTEQGTITVTAEDLIPVIEDGAIETDQDEPSDPLVLTITAGNGSPAQHTLEVTTQATSGICALGATFGELTYTPNAAFIGTDSCVITITDANGSTDTATISIDVDETAGVIVIDGGSSAVDPASLALLGGLPLLLRRRRKALALAAAATAAAGVLAAPAAMAQDDRWDWNSYDGFYIGAGVIGTSLETDNSFNSALSDILDDEFDVEGSGSFEDFPVGGQIFVGWMFNQIWGIEGRWSDSSQGESDILLVDGDEQEQIGEIEASIDGWTIYGVANWPVAPRWDIYAKLGYTDQDIDADISFDGGEGANISDDDSGFAAAIGGRWRFARHWATSVEGEYLGVDFDDTLSEPWRIGLNIEYWFGGNELPAPPPPAPVAVAAAPPPPPPPPACPDDDGDGVCGPADLCPDTTSGDRVGPNGCSCDVSRQLSFEFDSAKLTEADKVILDEMAETLNRLNFVEGVVEGHTDSVGSEAYNQGLSERRAKAVAEYLEAKGIAGARLQVIGRGETDPVGDNTTAEGRAQNRRVVAKRTDCDK